MNDGSFLEMESEILKLKVENKEKNAFKHNNNIT